MTVRQFYKGSFVTGGKQLSPAASYRAGSYRFRKSSSVMDFQLSELLSKIDFLNYRQNFVIYCNVCLNLEYV